MEQSLIVKIAIELLLCISIFIETWFQIIAIKKELIVSYNSTVFNFLWDIYS